MPASIFSVVDFPAPFGPMNATRSPGAIENDSLSTADTVCVSRLNRSRTRAPTPVLRTRRTRNDLDSWFSSTAAAGGMATLSCRPAELPEMQTPFR